MNPVVGSNFDHLEAIDPPRAALGRFAERYFVDDANTTLIKTRQFADRLAAIVAARPPQIRTDESAELRAQVEELRPRLAGTETEAQRLAREAQEAAAARLSAEEKAALAEEERAIYQALALEAEERAAAPQTSTAERLAFAAAAV